MAFNYKKATDTTLNYQKQLEDYRDDMNQNPPDEGATELQLQGNVHKDDDASVPFNKQLEKVRTGSQGGVTEKTLNESSKLYNDKRDDTTHSRNAKSQDLVAEAYDQEKVEAFKEAQKGQERDTSFWDDYVGVQMIGKETKITANTQDSQLPNHPDRYKGLKPDLKKKIDELVMASVQQADKMQFHIFAQAAMQERELNKDERQMITDINAAKARTLNAYEKANQTGDDSFFTQAQLDLGDDPLPMEPAGVSMAREPKLPGEFQEHPGPAGDSLGELDNGPSFVAQYEQDGTVIVLEDGKAIDKFDDIGEAKANYPELEI